VKLKVFLDSNIVIAHLQGNKELKDMFSKQVLTKIQYVITPIIYQEVLLFSQLMEERDLLCSKAAFNFFENRKEIITIVDTETKIDSEILRQFRNRVVHTNDIVILQAAVNNCDYFLTLDHALLQIRNVVQLKVISPTEFLKLMEDIR
jgi:predicted nucleic acid-binding protein